MSTARGNIGGRFVGRSRLYPWPVPGWFRAPARRNKQGLEGAWCVIGLLKTALIMDVDRLEASEVWWLGFNKG
jgi:hypothetical protein